MQSHRTNDQPEIQVNYSRFQSDLQTLAGKIGELEQEAEEHGCARIDVAAILVVVAHSVVSSLVLATLNEALDTEPDRKCFRLIGGVLVERTVKDVVPALQTNRDGVCPVPSLSLILNSRPLRYDVTQIQKVISNLAEQYKTKEREFDKFKQDYNIRPAGKASE